MILPQRIISFLSALLVSMSASTVAARPHQAIDSIDALDRQISVSLELLAEGNIQQARLLTRQMAWRFPDFALGQLIYAELESASAFQDVKISDHLPLSQNVSELLLEAQRRLAASGIDVGGGESAQTNHKHWPRNIVQIGKHLAQLVVVDLKASVLYHYETSNQQPVLIRQHYIGSGEAGFGKRLEGDLKTPIGVYAITGFRTEESLPDLYGTGALTLDYPNSLDQYLGRTGYGIWLHGVPPQQLSRTPYSSEGCVTMSNEHLSRLANELDLSNARVVLTNDATPLDPEVRKSLQDTFRDLFTRYQRAWMTGDETQLLGLYSDVDQLSTLLASGNNGLIRVNTVTGNFPQSPPDGGMKSLELSQYQMAFSAISPEQLSIFSHPDMTDKALAASPGIVINATFGPINEYQITTYWTQGDDGAWRVLTETAEGTGL
ncbi:MAG: murein L,D-transpeptidase family protein [Granulosicoccus sp.]